VRLHLVAANAEEVVAGAALCVVVLEVCSGVITRYVTSQLAPWAGEAAAFAWCVFVGAAAVAKQGGHVSIDMLTAAFPAAVQRAVRPGAQVLGIAFFAVASALALQFSLANLDNPSAVLRLPLAILYMAPETGFALMAVRLAASMRTRPGGWGA
jgi:TRAP-type C4-dicarboxylate transport system permease small subunit